MSRARRQADRAGHERGQSSLSPPFGDHPSRGAFAEEYPHLTGCLKSLALSALGYGALAAIVLFAGFVAGFWFGLGFLIATLFALYEAGERAIAMEAREGGNAEERSHAKHDSAGPQDIAHD